MVTNADAYEIRVWYTPDRGDEGFLAVVAEMPGVSAWGRTRDDALREIQAALRLVLSTYDADNEAPPPPLYGRANSLNYPWEDESREAEIPDAKKRTSRSPKVPTGESRKAKKSPVPNRARATAPHAKKKVVGASDPSAAGLKHSAPSPSRARVEEHPRIAA